MRIPRRDGVAPHVEIDENKAMWFAESLISMRNKRDVRQIAKQLTLQELRAGVVGNGISIPWIEFFIMRPMLHVVLQPPQLCSDRRTHVTRDLLANAFFAQRGVDPDFDSSHHQLGDLSSSRIRSKIIRDSLRGICRRILIFYALVRCGTAVELPCQQ